MLKTKQLNPSDKKNFSSLTSFPGEEGNPFDKILRTLERINHIPFIIFLVMIIILTGIFTAFLEFRWAVLLFFVLFDFLLLLLLPKLKISFGKPQSQTFLLMILRAIFIWLPFPINLILQITGSSLVIYGFFIEPSTVKLTKIKLSDDLKPHIKLIHISDIHLERRGVREEIILKTIQQNNPDLILFTGDFLNLSFIQNQEAINQVFELFNQMAALAPVFYVTGSPAVDVIDTIEKIETKTNAVRLNNSNYIFKKDNFAINLIGITCTQKPHQDINFLNSLIDSQRKNILLYHTPDLIYEINNGDKIALMLSGHTHGGQIRIPWFGPLFTGSLYGRKLQSGMYQLSETILYISRGIGLEGLGAPRVRFLCPPEIIEWTIN